MFLGPSTFSLQDETTSAIRELREETGFEGMVTHVSPIVYSDPGLSNASMRYVFMRIDGDLGSNQQPVAMPDEDEIITVHRVPVKRYGRRFWSGVGCLLRLLRGS